jgi:hypothetical protein
MAESRFSWGRVDKLTGAKELQRRGTREPGCKRRLIKDSHLVCWAPDCRKRPKADEWVYYPAAALAATNKVIGHVDCIDRMVAESKRSAYAQTIGTQIERLPDVHVASSKQPQSGAAHGLSKRAAEPAASAGSSASDLIDSLGQLAQLDRIRRDIYEAGFRDGVAAALAKLQSGESLGR